MDIETRELFRRMIGGSEEYFFRECWRKRTLFTDSAVPGLRTLYSYERFLEDYRRVDYHDATLLISVDAQGNRTMSRPGPADTVYSSLKEGMSVVVQVLLLPTSLLRLPEQWIWFLDLHRSLCNYLLPGFPARLLPGGPIAALDVFCTASETSVGGHYDTGDVFYFVLDGEKEWTVELVPDFDTALRLAAEGTNYKVDRLPRAECLRICVRPGDCLYVPPYTYHRVSSHGRSLAISVGLPTFNELSLIRNSLVRIQREHILFPPLPSFPRDHRSLFSDAGIETLRRTLSALGLPTVEKG